MTWTASPTWARVLDDAVSALTWSPDGEVLWSGTASGDLRAFDRSGQALEIGVGHERRVVALAADPTSGALASGDDRGRITLFRRDGTRHHLDAGSRPRTFAWSPDGGVLAVTSQAAGVLVVDEQARRVAALPASRRHLCAAWHDPTGPHQLAVAGAGSLRWLDLSRVVPAGELRRIPGVTLAAASAPGGWLALGDLRGTVTIANTVAQTDLQITGWPDPVRQLTWIGGSQHLVVVGGDQLTAWEPDLPPEGPDGPENGDPVAPLQAIPDGSPITVVAAHPWRPVVAVGTEAGAVAIWSPPSGPPRAVVAGSDPVSSLAWSRPGDALAVGCRSGVVRTWFVEQE